ncbi:unnamed protein product [Mesocestoides corti]|uniref:RNA helicase n=2 Tax=Mesocestoides corti TaxID=53468 RepID=A0A158QU78_MESCO|nr:unnamed protein product [Mesocestoides corti]
MSGGFRDLGLCNSLVKCCNAIGWTKPLPIQISAIPPSLKGNDIIGTSETGSGKTAAFLLPILQNWLNAGKPTGYALILAPTRELACQISETAKLLMENFVDEDADASGPQNPLNVFLLVGGENSADQAITLAWCRHHIIVATPGRLAEHMKQSPDFARHHLSTIKQIVLDEADRMLSLEFADDLDALLNVFERPKAPLVPTKHPNRAKKQTFLEKRANEVAPTTVAKQSASLAKGAKFAHPQTYLFTATMSKDVTKLRRIALRRDAVICTAARALQDEKADLKVELKVDLPAGLRYFCLPTRRADKLATLDWLIQQSFELATEKDFKIIVFCARCHETRYLAGFLVERSYKAVGLMGRMKQVERKRVLADFVSGKANVLVATDVASRGLDLPFVSMVINYGVPLTSKVYLHRVGRTARAGRSGTAVTIVTRDDGKAYLELESALLPVKPREPRRCIPRWPHPLPPENPTRKGEVCMSTRRRLADEAWSRAAKVLREAEARRLEEKRAHGFSSSDEDDDLLLNNGDLDLVDQPDLTNQHWASGAAGIEAARRAYAEDAARRKRSRIIAEEQEGEDGEDSDGAEDDRGNLHFQQPIKEKRAAISAAKKKKKAAAGGRKTKSRDAFV